MSVAQISVAEVPGPIGTGFLVGSGRYLITANHVFDAAKGSALRAGLAGVDHKDETLEVRAAFAHVPLSFLARDELNDVALFEVEMPPGAVSMKFTVEDVDGGRSYASGQTGPMKFSGLPVRDGNDIAISGFPLAAPALVTTRGIVASTFAPLHPFEAGSPVAYLCDVTAISGNSGGPVYRASDGSVIGLCRAVKLANVGGGDYSVPLTVVTPSEHIVALMESAGIDHGPQATPMPPAKPTKKRR